MPTVVSRTEHRRRVKLSAEVIHVSSNWHSNLEYGNLEATDLGHYCKNLKIVLGAYLPEKCGADLASQFLQLGIQRTLQDHGYGLVYHAICRFTPPAFAAYSL